MCETKARQYLASCLRGGSGGIQKARLRELLGDATDAQISRFVSESFRPSVPRSSAAETVKQPGSVNRDAPVTPEIQRGFAALLKALED